MPRKGQDGQQTYTDFLTMQARMNGGYIIPRNAVKALKDALLMSAETSEDEGMRSVLRCIARTKLFEKAPHIKKGVWKLKDY